MPSQMSRPHSRVCRTVFGDNGRLAGSVKDWIGVRGREYEFVKGNCIILACWSEIDSIL